MRRRDRKPRRNQYHRGNTSAYAEKSWAAARLPPKFWKYLRVCGEEHHLAPFALYLKEIPPRMRRRALVKNEDGTRYGNTSAYAEKSLTTLTSHNPRRKYLRVCGEERSRRLRSLPRMEIPPRIRRRVVVGWVVRSSNGNTSAYAEKSHEFPHRVDNVRKYLRVCGEEKSTVTVRARSSEIPPRMRRREIPGARDGRIDEIPPRMRRRADSARAPKDSCGNTSAYAEKSAR